MIMFHSSSLFVRDLSFLCSVWKRKFESMILAPSLIGGQSFLAVRRVLEGAIIFYEEGGCLFVMSHRQFFPAPS